MSDELTEETLLVQDVLRGLHVRVDLPYDVAVRLAAPNRDTPTDRRTLKRLLAGGIDQAKEWAEDWLTRSVAAADANYPQLVEAAVRGTYVSSNAWGLYFKGMPILVAPSEFWVGTAKVLASRGIQLQTVIVSRPRSVGGGCTVYGYRLRPRGDERGAVEAQEIRDEYIGPIPTPDEIAATTEGP